MRVLCESHAAPDDKEPSLVMTTVEIGSVRFIPMGDVILVESMRDHGHGDQWEDAGTLSAEGARDLIDALRQMVRKLAKRRGGK